ncbi:MAG: hypothetical protein WC372_11600 [Candidatus Neomarinimicrobiota bacterium]|jgi:hypothetical protein
MGKMKQTAENILSGPDYFYCERYRCRMKKTECIRRQTKPTLGFEVDYTNVCRDCIQGGSIMQECETINDEAIPVPMDRCYNNNYKMEGVMQKDKCIVDGCDETAKYRGLCGKHYNQWYNKKLDITPLPTRGKIDKSKKIETETAEKPAAEVMVIAETSQDDVGIDFYKAAALALIARLEHRIIDAVVEGLKD